MLRWFSLLLGLAIALCGSTAPAADNPTDEVLKRFFPDRDLSSAELKIANRADGFYAVADTVEFLADGRVLCMSGILVKVDGPANSPTSYSTARCGRMVLKFKRPVRQVADLTDNGLVSAELGS
jgi:hypothetical protein